MHQLPPPADFPHPYSDQLTDAMVDLYMQRLQLTDTLKSGPSIEQLTALQRAHVLTVPYETLSLHKRFLYRENADFNTISLNPRMATHNIVANKRGGTCLQLNTAFGSLLRTLGYDVTWHAASVHSPGRPSLGRPTHLTVVVHALPTNENPDGRWLAEVGIGNSPTAPLPLIDHHQTQDSLGYTLKSANTAKSQQLVTTQRRRTPAVMAWSMNPASFSTVQQIQQRNAADPKLAVGHPTLLITRDLQGTTTMTGSWLQRSEHPIATHITNIDDWYRTMKDVFNVETSDLSTLEHERLWQRTLDVEMRLINNALSEGPRLATPGLEMI